MQKIIIIIILTLNLNAQDLGIFDPFNYEEPKLDFNTSDENKSVETLINEASSLEMSGNPLDSRTKLLAALKKEPNNIIVNMKLSDYYTVHVNHYKLALKYIRNAEKSLLKTFSNPPYASPSIKSLHQEILIRIADSLTNIDNYEASLKTYEYYESLGYEADRINASKAWVLMKLKKIDEAIRVATIGSQSQFYGSYSLNVLAILKSMTGKREESLKIFNTALAKELALGSYGNPATPLNNSGEVLREIFREEEAKESWLKAMRLPDGCEHILPSLNLMTVNLDQLNLAKAKDAIEGFKGCIAQFPLRNGEEHKAILALAIGRIHYYSGNIDEALKNFQEGLNRTQWFGKIGTSSNDLKLALQLSYANALSAKAYHLEMKVYKNLFDKIKIFKEIGALRIKSWWYNRQALKLAIDQLNDFEDLYIRNSDSQIDYPALVLNLSSLAKNNLFNKVNSFKKKDDRNKSKLYYNAFLSKHLNKSEILNLISQCEEYDAALKSYLIVVYLGKFESDINLENELYTLNPASFTNNGIKLTVQTNIKDPRILKLLSSSLQIDNKSKSNYRILLENSELVLMKGNSKVKFTRLTNELEASINDFFQNIFSQEI